MQERILSLYRHHFIRYLFVGGSTFTMDFGLLVLLHSVFHVNVLVSATISYWTSIIYNFLMNRFWTFQTTENSQLARHIILYGCLLAFNYGFTIGFIAAAGHFKVHYTIAKVISVAIQMTWTYVIYRKYIFKT